MFTIIFEEDLCLKIVAGNNSEEIPKSALVAATKESFHKRTMIYNLNIFPDDSSAWPKEDNLIDRPVLLT